MLCAGRVVGHPPPSEPSREPTFFTVEVFVLHPHMLPESEDHSRPVLLWRPSPPQPLVEARWNNQPHSRYSCQRLQVHNVVTDIDPLKGTTAQTRFQKV